MYGWQLPLEQRTLLDAKIKKVFTKINVEKTFLHDPAQLLDDTTRIILIIPHNIKHQHTYRFRLLHIISFR